MATLRFAQRRVLCRNSPRHATAERDHRLPDSVAPEASPGRDGSVACVLLKTWETEHADVRTGRGVLPAGAVGGVVRAGEAVLVKT